MNADERRWGNQAEKSSRPRVNLMELPGITPIDWLEGKTT
jgi:hypothetical protein